MGSENKSKNRLIVPISASVAGNLKLAGSLYWIAISNHFDVLYLVLVSGGLDDLSISRRMATMNAYTADEVVHASYKILHTAEYLKTMENCLHVGDMLVPPLFFDEDLDSIEMTFLSEKILSTFSDYIVSLPGFLELKELS